MKTDAWGNHMFYFFYIWGKGAKIDHVALHYEIISLFNSGITCSPLNIQQQRPASFTTGHADW